MVNFGDKPARCITIAAIMETTKRYAQGKEKAASFLEYQTYLDYTTADADTRAEIET